MGKILSIIIPTYNAEKFLDRGLSSMVLPSALLMAQLEVLIVNDGTPDQSVAVAQKYADRYPATFKIINKENGGHGSAINAGVLVATGTYFKVVDADDWVDTEVLQKMLNLLQQIDMVDAVVQSYVKHDISREADSGQSGRAGNTPVEWKLAVSLRHNQQTQNGASNYEVVSMEEMMQAWDVYREGLCFHGIMYRTDFYRKQNYQLIEHVFYEDHEFATIPLCSAQRVMITDEALYIYRVGDVNQSVSVQSAVKRKEHYRAVIRKMLEFDEASKQCPKGGREYYLMKLSKFIADTYLVFLIQAPDRAGYRKFCKELTLEIRRSSGEVYRSIIRKYRVFQVLNYAGISPENYQNKFLPLLHRMRQ